MARDRRARRQELPFLRRPQTERYRTDRILEGRKRTGRRPKYDPTVHPAGIVDYFRQRYDAIIDPERFESEHRLEYVQAKVRPPSLAGYAASIGVSRECVWSWRKKHPEFDEAVGQCLAMQESVIIELAATGAYNPSFAALMMKNLHAWHDKIENTHRGEVTLNFDDQDAEA